VSYKKELTNKLWNKSAKYFYVKHEGKKELEKDPFIKHLKALANVSGNIIDCGCGNGAIIDYMWRKNTNFTGVDISELGIKIAKKRLAGKDVNLKVMDLENLKFKDNSFDLVFSTYVLEHLDNPEKVIKEMVRVTKKDGNIVFIAPNFGSPLNYSLSSQLENSSKTRPIKRFLKSHLYLLRKPIGLDWEKIHPLFLKEGKWDIDWDATVAPYLQTLIYYLDKLGVKTTDFSTNISISKVNYENITLTLFFLKSARRITEYFGSRGIKPYIYFGESLYLTGRKL